MMEISDTHVHFDGFAAEGRTDEILEHAAAAGVKQIMAIGGGADSNRLAVALAKAHPGHLRCACGYDRDEAGGDPDREEWRAQLTQREVVAVGECGLDYHYAPETAGEQKRLLELNLQMADEFELPVVVHSRDADEDTLGILREYVQARGATTNEPGVLHCYTRTKEMAEQLLDIGFYISFSGIVTFKNADPLREVAAYVPSDRLLIETDSPYLAPEPLRGKQNQPAYVVHVAERLAEVRGCTPEDIAAVTTANAEHLFPFA